MEKVTPSERFRSELDEVLAGVSGEEDRSRWLTTDGWRAASAESWMGYDGPRLPGLWNVARGTSARCRVLLARLPAGAGPHRAVLAGRAEGPYGTLEDLAQRRQRRANQRLAVSLADLGLTPDIGI